jgi:ABC-2 type transport system permease protein
VKVINYTNVKAHLERYRYSIILLKQLVKTDFKLRYQNSVLGYLWTLLRPLFLFVILYVVFVVILKTGGDIPYFGVYLLLGIIIWNFFVEVTNNSVGAIVAKGDILRKVNFPRYVVVLASSLSALINLSLNLLVMSIFIWIAGAQPNEFALVMPLLIVELFLFSLGIGFFLSAAYVKFRDLNYIWEVLLQAGFYATPILYAFSFVYNKSPIVGKIIMLNPMAQIIQDARYGLITNQTDTISTVFNTPLMYLIPIGIVVVTVIISIFYFRKQSPSFAENV